MDDFPPSSAKGAKPSAGTRVGPWELRDVIGSGGMGEVWGAVRVDGLHTGRAAVKLLRVRHHDAKTSAILNARFAREGELLAQLTHPHIAQLMDAGLADDGTRYLVLEYVAGKRIDRWCDERRLDLDERVQLLLQVCEAVAFAHAHLIVHRDLKPANILVTDAGHAKLLDFGVAKLLEDNPDSDDLTNLGGAGMTPQYAAPEQITGDAVTVATDVYALGVLTFVLLSGQRPYRPPGTQPAQVARAIAEGEPRRLSAEFAEAENPAGSAQVAAARSTTPEKLRQQLRGDLDHIVAKAMRKRPSERYASVQALADDLGRFLRHESVSARAATFGYLGRKFVQRHKVGVAAGALVAMAGVAGLSATLWQAGVAREQARLASTEAANATAIKEFLLGVFNTTKVGDGKATPDTSARDLLQNGGQQLLADHKLAPETRLELLWAVGALESNLNLYDAAEQARQEAQKLALQLYGPSSEKYIYALVERSFTLTPVGKPKEAKALASEALAIMERTRQQRLESYPVVLYELGLGAVQAGELAEGISYLKRATEAFDADQPHHQMRTTAHRWLGNGYSRSEQFEAAEREYRRSIALSSEVDEKRDYAVGLGHYALGDLYIRTGRYAEALTELQQALTITESTLGPRDRSVALMLTEIGRAEHALGHRAEADAAFVKALDVARDDRALTLSNVADRINIAMADAALDDGRLDEAAQRLHTAVDRWQKHGGLVWAMLLVSQAECESLRDQNSAALLDLQRALPVIDANLGATSISARHARVVLGDVQRRRGHAIDEARLAYAAALAPAADEAKPVPTRTLMQARAMLGEARLALSEAPAKALRLAHDAEALASTPPLALRGRILTAQAHIVEAQALAATGQSAQARGGMAQAVSTLTALQAPQSPRVAEARRAMAALAALPAP